MNTNIDAIKKELPTYTYGTGCGSWRVILMRNKAPYDDVRVRTALDTLIDRAAFVAARVPGYGSAAASPLLPPSLGGAWGLTDQETSADINTGVVSNDTITRAKALFAEAGVDISKWGIKIMALPIQVYLDDTLFIQSAWKKAGLNVTVATPTQADFNARRINGNFDTFFLPATSGVDDPDTVLGPWYPAAGGNNNGRGNDSKFETMYAEQSRTIDVAKRKALVGDLNKYILTTANW